MWRIITSAAWVCCFWIGIVLASYTPIIAVYSVALVIIIVDLWCVRKIVYVQRRYNRIKRLKRNGGSHTDLEWYRLCARYHWRCARCQSNTKLTKDHIIPVSKGGKDTIDNLQPLCQACNSSKGRKIIRY